MPSYNNTEVHVSAHAHMHVYLCLNLNIPTCVYDVGYIAKFRCMQDIWNVTTCLYRPPNKAGI